MIHSPRFISNAAVSVVQTVISGLVLFFLYRYLINNLGVEQLGLWSVVLASTSVARLSDMGLTGSVVKFVARYRALKDDAQAADVVQTAAISIAAVMAVLLALAYPLLNYLLTLAVPVSSRVQASSILPWAALSLWFGSVGAVFQSGLDGCQRLDIKNILMIIGNILYLAASVWLVPHYGLIGLAIAQSVQGALLMLASWLMLRRQLATLPLIPSRWSKEKFNEMLGYAVNFQITSIAVLLFDPAIKLLMSRYGGLSSAALYEMANQLITKLRALFIAANQALVPVVAELDESACEKIGEIYLKAYRLLFFIAVPFYAAIFVSLPIVSVLWIGSIENQFINFGFILIIGWAINTLMSPAYFINLGSGDLRWNSISHIAMAVLNVLLGVILGQIYGGIGVAIGAMTALVFGSCLVIYFLHKKYRIPFFELLPKEHFSMLGVVMLGTLISSWVNKYHNYGKSILPDLVVIMGPYLFIVGGVMWFHPYRKQLHKLLSRRR